MPRVLLRVSNLLVLKRITLTNLPGSDEKYHDYQDTIWYEDPLHPDTSLSQGSRVP